MSTNQKTAQNLPTSEDHSRNIDQFGFVDMQLLLKRDEFNKLWIFSKTIALILAPFAPKDAAFQALQFGIKMIEKRVMGSDLSMKVWKQ